MTASKQALASCGLILVTLVSCMTTESPEARKVWVNPETTTATYDARGRPTAGAALGEQVGGLSKSARALQSDWTRFEFEEAARAAEASTQAVQDPKQDPKVAADQKQTQQDAAKEKTRQRREALIRTSFGDAVIIGEDGRITKQYPLTAETGNVFTKLLTPFGTPEFAPKAGEKFGGKQAKTILGRMLGKDHEIEIIYVADFERVENFSVAPKSNVRAIPAPGKNSNSLLMVTATPSSLAAFEHALNLFFANMPQIEIEVKVVEYNQANSLSIGVQPINANTPTFNNLKTGRLIKDITSDFALTAPTFGTVSSNDSGLISLGGIHDSWELNAMLQLLETNGSADIKTQPRLVVRNGGLATISTQSEVPYPKARFSNNQNVAADIQFKQVGMVMHIRPEIAGTDTVTLLVNASVSAVTDFAPTEPVPTPVVATRAVTTSLHLKAGETTVIGGLVSQSTFDTETKVPLLGDIPLLGYLFRSTTTQTQRTTLEFWITPRILQGPRGQRPEGLGDF